MLDVLEIEVHSDLKARRSNELCALVHGIFLIAALHEFDCVTYIVFFSFIVTITAEPKRAINLYEKRGYALLDEGWHLHSTDH